MKMHLFQKNSKRQLAVIGLILVTTIGMAVIRLNGNSGAEAAEKAKTGGDGVIIKKSEVTSKARFYPVTVDGVKMEVFAVKASDGTIRTALNTCQVCFDSGRGYYVQEGDEMVCQNCGNRFQIDQIEKVKNGCNPVPITADLKKDNGKSITISRDILVRAKGLFGRWGKY